MLPSGWKPRQIQTQGRRASGLWGVLDLCPPWKRGGVRLAVAARGRLEARQARLAVSELVPEARAARATLLMVAPYLSQRTREVLRETGTSFLDATGNLELRVEDPLILVRLEGARKDPWPVERKLQSLRGPASARVVRALVDFEPPFRQLEVAAWGEASAPTVSRVIGLLEREDLLATDAVGRIGRVDWKGTIRRWSQDYGGLESHRFRSFLDPRGARAVLKKLAETGIEHAVTGELAAGRFGTFSAARNAQVYVEAPLEAGEKLGLVEVDAGANVLLVEPFDPVVFARSVTEDGLQWCAASQVVADLLTGPGRGPSAAELLMDWMEAHPDAWHTGSCPGVRIRLACNQRLGIVTRGARLWAALMM